MTPTVELTEDMVIESGPIHEAEVFDFFDDMDEEDWQAALDEAFEEAVADTRIERGVGYCENTDCEDYAKGLFIFHHQGPVICPRCSHKGLAVPERGIPYRQLGQPFGEIRIEYSYDPCQKRFREIAILTDESWEGSCGTYTLQTPLVRTEKRALKMAESLMSILNEGVFLDEDLTDPPRVHERILDLSKPLEEFREDLARLEQRLRDNCFLRGPVVSASSEEGTSLEEGEPSGSQSLPHCGPADQEPRILPRGNARGGALHLHDCHQSCGSGPIGPESRLHPLQSLGTASEEVCGESGKGRRSGSPRPAEDQLRSTARRGFSSILRSSDRRGSERPAEPQESTTQTAGDTSDQSSDYPAKRVQR